jgi:Flp pilus assembly pilin Flp
MEHIFSLVHRIFGRDEAQDLLEYAFLAALIAVVAVAAITAVGQQIGAVLWQTIAINF